MRRRLGEDAVLEPLEFGEVREFGPVKVSLHPAGHVLGSAQIRLEHEGEVWVFTGDFKREPDPSCEPFEVVPCDVLVTEATFALPIYRWDRGDDVARELLEWWRQNRAAGRCSIVYGYSLGKAQRLLAHLAALGVAETIYLHGAVVPLTEIYRESGIALPPTAPVADQPSDFDWSDKLVIEPPGAFQSGRLKRFGEHRTAFASGWMRIRGVRRRKGFDRGFVLSDHADWPALLKTIADTGCRRVLATHGRSDILVRVLRERGLEAETLETAYEGEAVP